MPFFQTFSTREILIAQYHIKRTYYKDGSQEDIGKIDIVVIFLGSNDASIVSTAPEQAVPLEEFGDNLLKIISLLLSKVRC